MTTAAVMPPDDDSGRRRRWALTMGGIAAAAGIVLVVLGIAALVLGWKDGKSVTRAEVGMCITVSGTTSDNVQSRKTDCDNPALNYYVTDKLPSVQDCKSANGFYATMSDSRSHKVLCLTPNLRVGSCYQDGDQLNLRQVPCATPSDGAAPVLRVTQRVSSTTVPDCGDANTEQVRTFADAPSGPIGYCLQVEGDLAFTDPN